MIQLQGFVCALYSEASSLINKGTFQNIRWLVVLKEVTPEVDKDLRRRSVEGGHKVTPLR